MRTEDAGAMAEFARLAKENTQLNERAMAEFARLAKEANEATQRVNVFIQHCAMALGIDLSSGRWTFDARTGVFSESAVPELDAARAGNGAAEGTVTASESPDAPH